MKPPATAAKTEVASQRATLRPWVMWAAFTLIAIVSACITAGASWPIVLTELCGGGLLLVVWLVACFGLGRSILSRWWGESTPLLVVSSIALGMGLISILVLLLGLAGAINRVLAIAVVVLGIAAALREMAKNVPGTFLAARGSNGRWLLLLLAPLLGIALTGALVPPGLLWGDEPNGYDVVEYHLQVPREWCEAGRITPLQHNAFSYFPFNVEMQYLLAMEIQGGPWKGMYLAQLMHVAMVALGIGAVYGLVKELGGSDLNASVGAVIAGSVPWMSWLAPVAYNEGGLILFGTLGVGWVLVAMREDAKSRAAVFAGVFAGLACGVKLTAVPVVVIATPIALLAARWSGRNLRRAILFVAFACVVFSPWLIRNIAWTGNPAFPEGMSIFGRGHFSEDQVERWSRAHSPTEQQRSIGARVTAFVDQIVTDSSYAWLLLPMAIAAAVLAWRRAECRTLAILIGLHALFWIAFTHLQGRFFVLLVPWGAILIALSLANLPSIRISAVGLSVAMAVIGLSVVITKVTAVQVRFNFFGQSDLSALTPLADEKPGPGTQVVLIGDAQAFFYQMPMKQLHYRTVFDVNARPDESVIDAWRAGAPSGPNTIDVINPSELLRFSRTYWKIPAPSPEIAAHERPFVVRH